jgi:hypothetical protein
VSEDFKWSETALLEALRVKFSYVTLNGFRVLKFVFATHVRDTTGFEAQNTIDAVAVNVFKASGHPIHAFEVKCSRADWLNEIKPRKIKRHKYSEGYVREALEKSARARELCDTFTIVAPKGAVKLDELPEFWGLIEATYSARVQKVLLRTKVKPKRLDGEPEGNSAVRHARSDRVIGMTFAVAIMRQIGKREISDDN